jgi:hypothetical protein
MACNHSQALLELTCKPEAKARRLNAQHHTSGLASQISARTYNDHIVHRLYARHVQPFNSIFDVMLTRSFQVCINNACSSLRLTSKLILFLLDSVVEG